MVQHLLMAKKFPGGKGGKHWKEDSSNPPEGVPTAPGGYVLWPPAHTIHRSGSHTPTASAHVWIQGGPFS